MSELSERLQQAMQSMGRTALTKSDAGLPDLTGITSGLSRAGDVVRLNPATATSSGYNELLGALGYRPATYATVAEDFEELHRLFEADVDDLGFDDWAGDAD